MFNSYRLILFSILVLSACAQKEVSKLPNVILIFSDDQGYSDLGAHQVVSDIKTPHLDALAKNGVLMRTAYVTAPQCTPSRAGILTGQYQQRFGLETNVDGPLHLESVTIAERLKKQGYTTAMVGKWHLEPHLLSRTWIRETYGKENEKQIRNIPWQERERYLPTNQGFDFMWMGEVNNYFVNYDFEGNLFQETRAIQNRSDRIELQTQASLHFLENHAEAPFFLYLPYFAPHVPLGAQKKYLDRFPGKMPERRRHALGLISAMDDGVGAIVQLLKEKGVYENTMIFFISDNGAPLALDKEDTPDLLAYDSSWDGSLNEPWLGEKGMLTEGGIRVPFIFSYPNRIKESQEFEKPVISLDVAATIMSQVTDTIPSEFDGVDLVPYILGEKKNSPHPFLYWRFWQQSAIRNDRWKYLRLTDGREFLFDLSSTDHETKNLIKERSDVAVYLRKELLNWSKELPKPGLGKRAIKGQEKLWYDFHLKDLQ